MRRNEQRRDRRAPDRAKPARRPGRTTGRCWERATWVLDQEEAWADVWAEVARDLDLEKEIVMGKRD